MRIFFLTCFFLFGPISASSAADKRVALVIGNNAYTELPSLQNPGFDAESLARVLAEHGFDVISCDGKRPGCFDLTRKGLTDAIGRLATKAQGADLAFVFYAGHGMGGPEGNILAPVDADIDCATQQIARGVLVDEVLEALAGAKQKIVVLDACRDNPLGKICPPATKAKLSFRDFKIPDAGNFLLLSSTKPGQKAQDGLPGAHSPFARALFAALSQTPTMYFDQVFNEVSKAVIEDTGKADTSQTQIPEMLVRGGAPEACLAGDDCAADPQAAALRGEVAALKRDHARDQELGETAKDYLTQVEKNRGKPFSEEERRRELASLKETTRLLAARKDNRGERALEKLKTGDTAEAEQLFQEDLDAEQADEQAEAARRAERRKKAAVSARNIAALARATDVAKAVAYYKRAVDLNPADAETWDAYARAAQDAGHTDEAKMAFEQAALKATGPGAGGIRYWAENGQGDMALAQGSLPQALQFYRSAQQTVTQLLSIEPVNEEWQRDLSVSYNNVGDVLVAQGNLPEALKSYQGSLAIRDRLAKADPGNAGWQRDLSVSYAEVGDVLVQQGDLSAALENFRRTSEILDRLAKADPGNAGWQRDLSVSYIKVGDVLVAQGSLPDALTSYKNSLAIADRLAKADPGNAGWQRDLSVSYAELANVSQRHGEMIPAKDALVRGQQIMERMTRLSPDNATWKKDLAWFEGQIAALPYQEAKAQVEAAFNAGEFAKAATIQTKLATMTEKAERETAGKLGADTASALSYLSWYQLFAHDFKSSLAASDRAIAIQPDRIIYATNKAHALLFLGRTREARALYLRYKGQRIEEIGKLWEEAIVDDFAEFDKHGLKQRQIAEIKTLLARKHAPGEKRAMKTR